MKGALVLDADGVVRWSHVSSLGITYQDSEKIAEALKAL